MNIDPLKEDKPHDLSIEIADRLEATKERFGAEWRRHGLKKLAVAGAVFGFVAIIGVLAYLFGIFERTNNPASWIGSPLVIGAVVIAAVVWLWQVFSGIGTITSNPPLAGITPEDTIEKYMNGPIIRLVTLSGKFGTPGWIQSYICLLDQAKDRFDDYSQFVSYWEETCAEIKKKLDNHFAPRSITDMTCEIEQIERISKTEEMVSYKIIVRIDATEGINSPGVSKPEPIGTAKLVCSIDMAQVGQRWYLISPYWNGRVN